MKIEIGGGLSIGVILTIIFAVLKLVDVISWSWWWVFAPILIEIGLVVLITLIMFIITFIGFRK